MTARTFHTDDTRGVVLKVYSDADGEYWGYEIHVEGTETDKTGLNYDSEDSAKLAALCRIGAEDLPESDPRVATLTVQMCRELWLENLNLNLVVADLSKSIADLKDAINAAADVADNQGIPS